MTATLLKSCEAIVTSASDPVLWHHDLLIEGTAIKAMGPNLSPMAPAECTTIDATGMFIYPGLINTHHHFFQCFVVLIIDLDLP